MAGRKRSLVDWLYPKWVAATAVLLAILLAYAPLGLTGRSYPVAIIFGFGPLYMLHQIEEHADDRFRRYANDRLFGGRDALSRDAVLRINLPLVWGGNLLALYAAVLFGPGWGLAAAYLTGVNAVSHIAAAVRMREYNPGVGSALVLFAPMFVIAMIFVPGSVMQHMVAGAIAAIAHLAIIVVVVRRAQRLCV